MRKRIDEIILEDIVLVSFLVLAVRPDRRKQGDADAEDKENYAQEDQERLVESLKRCRLHDEFNQVLPAVDHVDVDLASCIILSGYRIAILTLM